MTATRSRAESSVDPRLAARRASVAKRAGVRRLRILAALTLVATLAIVVIAAAKSSWFDVESVEVVGADRADPRHVANASGIVPGEPLIELDLAASARAVEDVPWVAEATIDRDFDGTVTISVVERHGVTAVPAGQRFAIIDRTGRQLELVASPPEEFLPVSGVEASGVPGQPVDDAGLAVVSLVEALTPAVHEVAGGITVDDEHLFLELAIGGRANLGDGRGVEEKLVALETILVRVDLGCVAVIDVRVPAAPTITRTGTPASTRDGGLRTTDEEPFDGPGGC